METGGKLGADIPVFSEFKLIFFNKGTLFRFPCNNIDILYQDSKNLQTSKPNDPFRPIWRCCDSISTKILLRLLSTHTHELFPFLLAEIAAAGRMAC